MWAGPPKNHYSQMVYENGEPCWQGGSRTTTVSKYGHTALTHSSRPPQTLSVQSQIFQLTLGPALSRPRRPHTCIYFYHMGIPVYIFFRLLGHA